MRRERKGARWARVTTPEAQRCEAAAAKARPVASASAEVRASEASRPASAKLCTSARAGRVRLQAPPLWAAAGAAKAESAPAAAKERRAIRMLRLRFDELSGKSSRKPVPGQM